MGGAYFESDPAPPTPPSRDDRERCVPIQAVLWRQGTAGGLDLASSLRVTVPRLPPVASADLLREMEGVLARLNFIGRGVMVTEAWTLTAGVVGTRERCADHLLDLARRRMESGASLALTGVSNARIVVAPGPSSGVSTGAAVERALWQDALIDASFGRGREMLFVSSGGLGQL